MPGMKKPEDLFGKSYGDLVAIKMAPRTAGGCIRWLCKCRCGGERVVHARQLKGLRVTDCGCKSKADPPRLDHGHARKSGKSLTYKKWAGMKRRCDNPNEDDYPRYGGRGIVYDPRWAEFPAFLEDMGECPEGYSLERDKVNGNYCKENCRWIPEDQQARNTRRTHWVEFQGARMSVAEFSERTGIPHGTALYRFGKGWSAEKVASTPLNDYRSQITFRGKTQHLAEWSRDLGMPYAKLYLRLNRRGWSVEKAFTTP